MKKVNKFFLGILSLIIYLCFYIPLFLEIHKINVNLSTNNTSEKLSFIQKMEIIPNWSINLISIGSAVFTILGFILTVKQCIDAKQETANSKIFAERAENAEKEIKNIKQNAEKEIKENAEKVQIDTINRIQNFLNSKKEFQNQVSMLEKFKSIRIKITELVKRQKEVSSSDKIFSDVVEEFRKLKEEPLEKQIESFIDPIIESYGSTFSLDQLKQMEKTVLGIIQELNEKVDK